MKKYDITLKIVTPCISSGADQKSAELRAPSIRGQLRHWFRVLGGQRQEEIQLFGGIGKKNEGSASKVIVRVLTPSSEIRRSLKDGSDLTGNSFDYFLWPMRNTKYDREAGLRGIVEPQKVKVQIIDRSDNTDFEKCLKAFLYLGAIGSRSRRAYGSVFPVCVSCNGELWDIPDDIEQLISVFHALFKGVKVTAFTLDNGHDNWREAIRACADFLKGFRCGSSKSGTPSKWGQNDHDIRNGSTETNYRAAIGLPLTQRYSDGNTFQTTIERNDPLARPDSKNDRWASPVCFKVLELNGHFLPVVFFLQDFFMPEMTKLRVACSKTRDVRGVDLSQGLVREMMASKPESGYWLLS